MPRKGPPKTTRREERAKEKEEAAKQRLHEEAKAARAAQAVRQFRHNPEMPDTQGDRRDLRRGLASEGMPLERYGESPMQLGKRGEVLPASSGGRAAPRGFEYDAADEWYGDDDD
ncbi:hypothetical protein SDRG_06057 [Saprolegnia diclina VS20]|uniref:Uncharacterized protein n=1 Tax=Saprolegnia diclina (strain VS20) TaxID=1156394 RepID=T0S1Q2_SAPDV|nr:hypothetical protein SDRG_06057 [Saprolegnia diclina VS20]EQC36617.1 hypothetical protein SDRG_06057 [Saprolegnia diclina VS20]|eukprot:XP_008610038.1 hypothetical protein SDRG_06057 [Saprolegnia diclina VS20]